MNGIVLKRGKHDPACPGMYEIVHVCAGLQRLECNYIPKSCPWAFSLPSMYNKLYPSHSFFIPLGHAGIFTVWLWRTTNCPGGLTCPDGPGRPSSPGAPSRPRKKFYLVCRNYSNVINSGLVVEGWRVCFRYNLCIAVPLRGSIRNSPQLDCTEFDRNPLC